MGRGVPEMFLSEHRLRRLILALSLHDMTLQNEHYSQVNIFILANLEQKSPIFPNFQTLASTLSSVLTAAFLRELISSRRF
jgi:hypothetical protein